MTVEDRGAEETGEVAVETETEIGTEIETGDLNVDRKDLVGTAEWTKDRGTRSTTTGACPEVLNLHETLEAWGGPHWPPPGTDMTVNRDPYRRPRA